LRHVVHITVVVGGMLSSTLLAIPFVPVFYVALERLSERLRKSKNSQ
jgi:HAE1 family hydrophobic/amphiphilic exporter-1